jgi:hypothetical protein
VQSSFDILCSRLLKLTGGLKKIPKSGKNDNKNGNSKNNGKDKSGKLK